MQGVLVADGGPYAVHRRFLYEFWLGRRGWQLWQYARLLDGRPRPMPCGYVRCQHHAQRQEDIHQGRNAGCTVVDFFGVDHLLQVIHQLPDPGRGAH